MNAQVEQPHYSAGNTNIVRPCTMFVSSFSSEKLAAARNHRRPWHVQKLTSLSIFEREFLLCKNIAAAWNHRHPWRC